MNKEKQYAYQKRYMRGQRMITFSLNKGKDADLLEWLDNQPNRSSAIRDALRKVAGL